MLRLLPALTVPKPSRGWACWRCLLDLNAAPEPHLRCKIPRTNNSLLLIWPRAHVEISRCKILTLHFEKLPPSGFLQPTGSHLPNTCFTKHGRTARGLTELIQSMFPWSHRSCPCSARAGRDARPHWRKGGRWLPHATWALLTPGPRFANNIDV